MELQNFEINIIVLFRLFIVSPFASARALLTITSGSDRTI